MPLNLFFSKMTDIIQLLPDSIANQIAAGEVIQRPASVVKELVENSVDAKASNISVNIQDSGKTLIQITDNGIGMSETDARMAFERHATSKIKNTDDLFAITTFGFRGEALPSIAAVSQVELRTKQENQHLGTLLIINGSQVEKQEVCSCQKGSNFVVKNLFFNIPARRKFLKADSTEFRHISAEFERIVLAHPEIEFSLKHNGNEILNLPNTSLRQRIVGILGKQIQQQLTPVQIETPIVKISGFIGKPENAKKMSGEQYFFVNQRFMRHNVFHKAVLQAYDQIIAKDDIPSYFLYFEVPPSKIDVNIHPTKTEIKFLDENTIFQVLVSAVKEAIGKFNLLPPIDFETTENVDIPILTQNTKIIPPSIKFNENYNPFSEEKNFSRKEKTFREKQNLANWEKLYQDFKNDEQISVSESENETKISFIDSVQSENLPQTATQNSIMQLKNKYILTSVKSGLMIIDQKGAHERILYEKFLREIESQSEITSQQILFPLTIELNRAETSLLNEIRNELFSLGFDIAPRGENSFLVQSFPSDIQTSNIREIILSLLENYKHSFSLENKEKNHRIAYSSAKTSAISYGKILSDEEMQSIIDNLFACEIPNYSPDGKKIVVIISGEEIENRF